MIIIQLHTFVSEVELQRLHRCLVEQAKDGIILIPASCSLLAATQTDTETEIEIIEEG